MQFVARLGKFYVAWDSPHSFLARCHTCLVLCSKNWITPFKHCKWYEVGQEAHVNKVISESKKATFQLELIYPPCALHKNDLPGIRDLKACREFITAAAKASFFSSNFSKCILCSIEGKLDNSGSSRGSRTHIFTRDWRILFRGSASFLWCHCDCPVRSNIMDGYWAVLAS